jgi:hypothetical protein
MKGHYHNPRSAGASVMPKQSALMYWPIYSRALRDALSALADAGARGEMTWSDYEAARKRLLAGYNPHTSVFREMMQRLDARKDP